jgi:flagellar secretion chaperone FliS
MKINSTHALYKEVDVSCSQTQLVLMLFDGAIRYTREAADHLRAQRWAEKGIAVDSALECVAELRRGLDLKNGGEAASSLDRMYDFLSTKLSVGNVTRDAGQFEQVVESLNSLREAWRDLFERLRVEGKLADGVGTV